MRLNTQGFSLLELMIAMTIIAILVSMAIPSYQTYIHRARFAEVITATEPFKIAVALALQQGDPMDELFNDTFGIPSAIKNTKNISSIIVDKGIITATATALIKNETFILQPNEDGSHWTVSGTCLQSGLCHD